MLSCPQINRFLVCWSIHCSTVWTILINELLCVKSVFRKMSWSLPYFSYFFKEYSIGSLYLCILLFLYHILLFFVQSSLFVVVVIVLSKYTFLVSFHLHLLKTFVLQLFQRSYLCLEKWRLSLLYWWSWSSNVHEVILFGCYKLNKKWRVLVNDRAYQSLRVVVQKLLKTLFLLWTLFQ